ncbi:MAG: DNA alkylation repair protein [Calditrichaeota bacterium]|nr:MAG: DNA alkylation repair protein [Calditrichota bacterium]
MTFNQVMAKLKKMGTAQNVKIYRRHGAQGELFGVSFANLKTIQKKIKVDHELASKLWLTGNADAQSLATMIADPELLSSKEIDSWAKLLNYYLLSDLFGGLVAKTKFAETKHKKWVKAKDDFIKQCGYTVLTSLLMHGADFSKGELKELLKMIEKNIHSESNRAKHAMNMTLISIGIYREDMREMAIKTAEKIGKVDVDHGETSCKTPDAIPYIEKAVKRQKNR